MVHIMAFTLAATSPRHAAQARVSTAGTPAASVHTSCNAHSVPYTVVELDLTVKVPAWTTYSEVHTVVHALQTVCIHTRCECLADCDL